MVNVFANVLKCKAHLKWLCVTMCKESLYTHATVKCYIEIFIVFHITQLNIAHMHAVRAYTVPGF